MSPKANFGANPKPGTRNACATQMRNYGLRAANCALV